MRSIENVVLVRALGELGGSGARFVARWLPSVAHELTLSTREPANKAIAATNRALLQIGRPIVEIPSDTERGELAALVGGGGGGLNPTVVRVKVTPSAHGALVSVRAVAKEGLVKQRTAEGVARRLDSALREILL